MPNNSLFNHIKNIVILPGIMTGVIPYCLVLYLNPVQIANDTIILRVIGLVIFILGILLLFRCIFLFGSFGKGTLAPWNPTRKLVIKGPYKYLRNPMILGVLGVLLGESLYFNSISVLIWCMLFFIVNSIYFELVEEPKLERKFGDAYIRYKNAVSRWLPALKPYSQD